MAPLRLEMAGSWVIIDYWLNPVKPNENTPEHKWRTAYEFVTQM